MKQLTKEQVYAWITDKHYISDREVKIIYPFLEKLPKKGRLLELGTGRGHSTFIFSQALPGWTIYTVDAYGSAGTPPLLYGGDSMLFDGSGVWEVLTYLKQNGTGNCIQIVGSFKDLPWELSVDLLFIDGSHWYKDIKEDWEKFSPFIKDRGSAILHDYNQTFEVQDYFDKEVIPTGKWKVTQEETIGLVKKL